MSRIDQHAIFGFWIYMPFYFLLTGTFDMDRLSWSLILFFSIFPDLDSLYFVFKSRGNFHLDETFQHHYKSITHYPLFFTPLIILFIVSLILNFYPAYFLAPVIGLYGGHFLFDSISCGDGIMWGKNPFTRKQYGRFINVDCQRTDGYHGKYWYARYRKTLVNRFGNLLLIGTMILYSLDRPSYNYNYNFNFQWYHIIGPIIFTSIFILIIRDAYSKKWKLEPPNGRYSDYRKDTKYINGLNEKNRIVHLKKYSFLLK